MSNDKNHIDEAESVIREIQAADNIMTDEEKRGRLSTAINHLKCAKPGADDD